MEEAQEALDIEFDLLPPPALEYAADENGILHGWQIDLDTGPAELPPAGNRAQAFVLWLRSAEFAKRAPTAAELIARLLTENPHTTLQVTLEPTACPEQLTAATLESVRAACYGSLSYLDRFYSLQPASRASAKRLVVVLPLAERDRLGRHWRRIVAPYASVVWRAGTGTSEQPDLADLDDFEHLA